MSGNNLSANVGAGILVEPSGGGSTLRDNSITGSAQGIFSYDAITIMNNTVFGNTNGIDVAGAGSSVVLNRVSGSTGRGIMVEIQGNVWVANNNVSGNGQGIQLYQTSNNTILGNIVTNNRDGIFSGSGTFYNTIDNNTVTGNEYGITLDLSTGDTILRNDVAGNRQGGITDASFGPRGHLVVTTSSDGATRVWDARTGARVALMLGHVNAVNAAAFSPDGKFLVTVSAGPRRRDELVGRRLPRGRELLVGLHGSRQLQRAQPEHVPEP